MSVRHPFKCVIVFITTSLAIAQFCAAGPTTEPSVAPAVRFTFVDITIDTKDRPLAAYQFEFTAGEGAQIVGIEGGEHAAFANPPYYDPAAMQNDRVIAAAYSTAGELPKGRTRVTRIHLHLTSVKPAYAIRLVTSASSDGKPMSANISIQEGALP